MFALHYKPKKISEIDSKADNRVSLVGKVIENRKSGFVLDDDTGKIEIVFEGDIKPKKMVRVFCSLVDGQLKADVVQNLEGLDLNLFKKVKELYNKAELNV